MYQKKDHTDEVEQCIATIHISPWDSCSFFMRRKDVLLSLRQCAYCAYSVFEENDSDIYQKGLCKYKR